MGTSMPPHGALSSRSPIRDAGLSLPKLGGDTRPGDSAAPFTVSMSGQPVKVGVLICRQQTVLAMAIRCFTSAAL